MLEILGKAVLFQLILLWFTHYWSDAITIALEVYYKERTYSILYYIDKKLTLFHISSQLHCLPQCSVTDMIDEMIH